VIPSLEAFKLKVTVPAAAAPGAESEALRLAPRAQAGGLEAAACLA
jgi:hypothetical protein